MLKFEYTKIGHKFVRKNKSEWLKKYVKSQALRATEIYKKK